MGEPQDAVLITSTSEERLGRRQLVAAVFSCQIEAKSKGYLVQISFARAI